MQQIEAQSGFNFTQNITIPDFAEQLQDLLGNSVNISEFLDGVLGTRVFFVVFFRRAVIDCLVLLFYFHLHSLY